MARTRARATPVRSLITAALLAASSQHGEAQTAPTTILRQLYGDVAIEVQRVPPLALRVAAADSSRTLTVNLMARDVIRWTDSATNVLDARLRGKVHTGKWQAVVEEPGSGSGSLVFAKTITESDTTITVLVVDTDFEEVRFTLDPYEARAFVFALRRAARLAINPPKRRPPPVPRKKDPSVASRRSG